MIAIIDCLEAISTAEITLSTSIKAMLRNLDIIYRSIKDMYADMGGLYHDLEAIFEDLEDIFVESEAKAAKNTFNQKKITDNLNMSSAQMKVVSRSMNHASCGMKFVYEGCKSILKGVKGIYCSMESFSTNTYKVCRNLETAITEAKVSRGKSKGSPLNMKTFPIDLDKVVPSIKCMRSDMKRAYAYMKTISLAVQTAFEGLAVTFDAMTCATAYLEDTCVDMLNALECTQTICKRQCSM